jgi:chitin synthase
MSEVHQSMPSRPVTNYFDVAIPTTRSPEGEPTDSELDRAVQDILQFADLNSVTKREIRRKLEDQFGMDLTSRKATINQSIDRILLNHA